MNEISGDGTVSKSIIKGLSQIAEISADGTITYVHQDILDSTVLLTNQAGEIAAEYEYDVFGDIIGANEGASFGAGAAASEKTNYLFTNQEFDPESDLYYYNARYYNPALGRFISRDAVLGKDGDILSRNLFVYVKNNPLKYTDPTGNEERQVYVSVKNKPGVLAAGIASDIYGSVKSGVSSAWDATKAAAAWTWDTTKTGTLQTLDMLPISGDLSDAYAMHFGRTLFSGQELSQEDLDLIGAMATVPLLTGGQARAGKRAMNKIDDVIGATQKAIKRLSRMDELNREIRSLEKGITSYQKRINEHTDKILNPFNYLDDLTKLKQFIGNSQYRTGLIDKWTKDIKIFENNIGKNQKRINELRIEINNLK